MYRSDAFHPFGSQASDGDDPSALGFASRSCDWFAFIEDEEVAGLTRESRRLDKVFGGETPRRGRLAAVPRQAHAFAFCLYYRA